MRLFLDTNVLYDLFQTERLSHKASNALVKASASGGTTLMVTATSIMTMVYSLQKYKIPMQVVAERMTMLIPHFIIVPVCMPELIAGINSGWTDLEDAIQFNAAISSGHIDAIVSNDRDFKQQKLVKVITPAQALKLVK